jgi:ankyrin repeat protein
MLHLAILPRNVGRIFIASIFAISLSASADSFLDHQLLEATLARDLSRVTSLIEQGADPNCTTIVGNHGRTMAPPIVAAAGRAANVPILSYMLDHGGSINVRSDEPNIDDGVRYRRTPLLEAAYWAEPETARLLIDRGAKLDDYTEHFRFSALTYSLSALGYASTARDVLDLLWNRVPQPVLEDGYKWLVHNNTRSSTILDYAHFFFERGISIDALPLGSNGQPNSLLRSAIYNSAFDEKFLKTVEYLLNMGADPDLMDPLSLAFRQPLYDKLYQLLLAKGSTPKVLHLRLALDRNRFSVADILLAHGLDIDEPLDGRPLLFSTVGISGVPFIYRISLESLQYLVDHKANIKSIFDGDSPLVALVRSGGCFINNHDRTKNLKFLLDNGADPNFISNRDGNSALILTMNGLYEAYQPCTGILLSYGADPKITNASSQTPVYYGFARILPASTYTLNGWIEIIRATGNGLNIPSSDGTTVLHQFVIRGDIWEQQPFSKMTVLDEMLAAGVNPNIQDRNGRTALMMQPCNIYLDVAARLLENGADPKLVDSRGRTAKDHALACPEPNLGFIQLLDEYSKTNASRR